MSALPPDSGHSSVQVGCPLCARSRHGDWFEASRPAGSGAQKAAHQPTVPGGRAGPPSFRAVAYGFDIVAVRIEHEGRVIGGVVLGPEPWRPVVSAPCRDRGMIENI